MTNEDHGVLNRELILAEYEMLTDQVDLRHQSWERAVQFGFSIPTAGIFYLELEHGDKPHLLLWVGLVLMLACVCYSIFRIEQEIRSLGGRIADLESRYREPATNPYHLHVENNRRLIPILQQVLSVYSFPVVSIFYALMQVCEAFKVANS
jgi:hypothetical protein